MDIAVVIIVSIITSYITTKSISIKYFDVIDAYAKGLMDDIKESVRAATRNKRIP